MNDRVLIKCLIRYRATILNKYGFFAKLSLSDDLFALFPISSFFLQTINEALTKALSLLKRDKLLPSWSSAGSISQAQRSQEGPRLLRRMGWLGRTLFGGLT